MLKEGKYELIGESEFSNKALLHTILSVLRCQTTKVTFYLMHLTQKKLSHAKYADLELEMDHIRLNASRAESTETHHNKH